MRGLGLGVEVRMWGFGAWSLGCRVLLGYLAHKQQPPSIEPPKDPGYSPTVRSKGGGVLRNEVPL